MMVWKSFTILCTLSTVTCASYQIGAPNNTDIEFVLINDNNPCHRTCVKGSEPMRCHYTFSVEWYRTMSKACYLCPFSPEDCDLPHCIPGEGSKRTIAVVNRQMPGPSIEVCLGDEVIVDVTNKLLSDSTSMHWHGFHQTGTPYMDGVPYVTQCPIQPGATFRYHFKAENYGTHFWHSHSGFQRADGVFGPFIVRVPDEFNPHISLYDYDLSEHIVMIMDWGTELGIDKYAAHHHSDGDNKPRSILVNGRGMSKGFLIDTNTTTYIPPARFVVEKNYRYRFRVTNSGFLNCPIEMSIDNHTLTVISSDGKDIEPVEVDSLVLYAGERFDFVLNANQEIDLYWMRFSGLMDCDARFTSVFQGAVLQYKNASETGNPSSLLDYASSHRQGLQLNPLNKGTEDNETITMPKLVSLDGWDDTLKEKPDYQFHLAYDFYKINNPHFHQGDLYGFFNVSNPKQRLLTPQLNRISMTYQDVPILQGRDTIDDKNFCNSSTIEAQDCADDYCECTHVLQVALNSVVELVMIDEGFAYDANHPFHLHGNYFRVVAMKRLGSNTTLEEVKRLDAEGKIKRNLMDAVVKDTVTVPDGGYTILRFKADNPGYWMMHCHIDFHVEIGMAVIFKVGENHEMPPVPKDFPTCGNYLPEISKLPTINPCIKKESIYSLKYWFPTFFDDSCNSSSGSSSIDSNRISVIVLVLIFTKFFC
ncbi:laccase-like isoform X3 [Agrilus planipennis]|nr:laccase-like isoform X2 [Agrilus planipennis]XP_025836117.1 laccase-like isoform X3 [Agrilus planipennis]